MFYLLIVIFMIVLINLVFTLAMCGALVKFVQSQLNVGQNFGVQNPDSNLIEIPKQNIYNYSEVPVSKTMDYIVDE